MLAVSVGLFTIVALIGLVLTRDVFRRKVPSGIMRYLHVCLATVGSLLVIFRAFTGDHRLFVNIGLAVTIIALGLLIWRQRATGARPRMTVFMHGGIAVPCYILLAYFKFTPQ